MPDEIDMTLYGHHLAIELLEDRAGGGARLDITHADGRRWRLAVTATGELDHMITTWRDGKLADLDDPDWLDDLLVRLRNAPA